MAVVGTDLKLYAALENPNNDVDENGGAIDVASEITGILDELFQGSYSKETGGGDRIVYKKCFFKNTNATTALTDAVIWMSADEHDYITLDLESSKDGNDTSANRITAPDGYSFAEHNTEETAHAIPTGTLAAGEAIGIWLKLTIPAGESADASIIATLKCKGATAA